ncbi:MAG: hypothetical protein ACP5JS_04345 [Fervidobacterium sp.]
MGMIKSLKNARLIYVQTFLTHFLLLLLLLSVLSSCGLFIVKPIYIKLIITEYNSGPVVTNADVLLFENGEMITNAKSNSQGVVTFNNLQVNNAYKIIIRKEGHSFTIIDITNLQSPLELNTTLRKAKFLASVENNISIDFELYDSYEKNTKFSLNKSGIYEIPYNDILYIEATATYSTLPISTFYAKLGNVPGSQALTMPRLYSPANTLNGELQIPLESGLTYLFFDCYDENDNRYEKIIPLKVETYLNIGTKKYIVEPQKPGVLAYHLNTSIEYYRASEKILEESDEKTVGKTNKYIIVRWKKWENSGQRKVTDKPTAYRIYRSYDGKHFSKIATVPNNYDYFIDTSAQNLIGRRVWYAVNSVYGSIETQKVDIGSTLILPLVSIEDIEPSDGAMSVSTRPVFSWKFTGLEEYENIEYWYEIWIYDLTINDMYYYPLDEFGGRKIFKSKDPNVSIRFEDFQWNGLPHNQLQSNKPYEWAPELAAGVYVDIKNNSVSLSILSDYNFVLAPVMFPPEKYYLFITGE